MTTGLWVAGLAGLVGSGFAGIRWLRVAQREHYLPGSAGRFAWRWWGSAALNRSIWALAAAAVVVSAVFPVVAVVTAAAAVVGPVGLGVRGRTAKLAWTGRLRRLAAVWGAMQVVALAGSVLLAVEVGGGAYLLGVFVLGVPLIVDFACALAAPVERRLVSPFVRRAAARLAAVGPVVVGITGSFGKTGTKGYVAHLLGGSRSVVASPASYNNRTGLARAINEGLAPGTEVFVAEMGTYGPGEIAELCTWVRPSVAVITAIGPVHLERMRNEEAILTAKSEILVEGAVAVLNVDDPRLAELAASLTASGRRVWRCSATDPAADVWVGEGRAVWAGAEFLCGPPPAGAPPTNVACAVAVALELGAPRGEIGALVASLPVAPNRLSQRIAEVGFTIVDDTYNSNPAGAAMALAAIAGLGSGESRRVLVTPGMVELGTRQSGENEALAAAASSVVSHLVVVGRTNRRALLVGSGSGAHPATEETDVAGMRSVVGAGVAGAEGDPERCIQVLLAGTRDHAVAWAKRNLGPGDVVLYENDLPDHYP